MKGLKFAVIVGFLGILIWTIYTGHWGWGILCFVVLTVLFAIVAVAFDLDLDNSSSQSKQPQEFRVVGAVPEHRPMVVKDASARAVIAELVSIGQKDASDRPGASSRFLRQAKSRAREIGEQLNALGGNDYMLAGHEAVRQTLGAVAARELEVAWNGIGEWLG